MGFGLLFVGYFISYVMSYVFIPKLLGCLIMLAGVIKLSEYELKFKKCVPALCAMSVASAYMLVRSALESFSIESVIFNELAVNIVFRDCDNRSAAGNDTDQVRNRHQTVEGI